MNYLSVCSGIEAFTVAMRGTEAKPVAFCEFDNFPSAVLAHHWPEIPNLGDMTKWREWPESMLADVDALVGGTPCQAFSIAGLRQSLADERGNLTLTYVHIFDQIDKIRARDGRPPAVCLWENVPGVLNTDDNAFGCFLAALAGEIVPLEPPGGRWTDAGYVRGPRRTIAWRSLDAQYFGLAQRRQRVFVVAGSGEEFRPEEILFEFKGVRRDSPPSRGAGQGTAHDVVGCLTSSGRGVERTGDTRGQDPVIAEIHCMATGQAGAEIGIGIGTTLNCNHEAPIVTTEIVESLCADSHPGSYSGQDAYTGRLVPEVAFKASHFTRGKDGAPQTIAPPLSADADKGDQDTLVCVQTYANKGHFGGMTEADVSDSLRAKGGDTGNGGETLVCVHGTQDPCTDENLAFALGGNSGQENAVYTLAIRGRGDGRNLELRDDGTANSLVTPNGGRDGIGCGAVAFQPRYFTRDNKTGNAESCGDVIPALSAQHSNGDSAPCVAFAQNTRDEVREMAVVGALADEPGMKQTSYIRQEMAVRRLTPVECARLQGFPDHHTDIRPKGKPTADGPQYKAYGNSMAVPCMTFIGKRLMKAMGTTAETSPSTEIL